MNDNDIPGQELVEALTEQRNRAMNDAALALARSVKFRRERDAALATIAELKAEKEGVME